ncbi:glycogen synthase GlgA [Clostridium aceticum]|uniref:Glycogen synthase n=1 Tax=Clostridium aceticum TaxID=84022 RepID=A0A0D8IBB8_9CLOT|nr:glycogen synthase GlgA [Clostridium aceticum]AKL96823.1 glycogen synthase GlgA [Clostridium aceticum]KJF27573.1 glycogen synthase [Clostridium aceticum]
MNILFAASEAVPFAKTGGLGDVVGSLPLALKGEDMDVRVVIPKYDAIAKTYKKQMKWIKSIHVPVGWRNQFCGIEMLEYRGIIFYFVDNEYYFKREGQPYEYYGHYDDAERYAFFCKSILAILPHIDFKPDIIHCHDWQTGMVSALLKAHYRQQPFYEKIKTVFTIHNLKYQGLFPHGVLEDLLGLGKDYFHHEGVEYYYNVSYIKGGLNFSDYITTVSPAYAEEIQSPYYGEGLDGVLSAKKHQLMGIINGIDDEEYNPETDDYLFKKYNIARIEDKVLNKLELQKKLKLPIGEGIPIMAIVSRLVEQKGLDLIEHVLEEILQLDLQLVILGTGDNKYHKLFSDIAMKYPNKVSANTFFDNGLAHQIYGASDLFLMPSLFEPCGLGQLIALRYGSLPIVRETGGLKDTVKSYNEETGEGNGFSFANYNAHDMLYTIKRAVKFYHDKKVWDGLVKNAMKSDVSWNLSADQYKSLYNRLINQ